jgi:SAM-dependent methyltransferase
MGVSSPENNKWFTDLILRLKPKTFLDVGAGAGKYLNLIRASLGEEPGVTALEVWEPYIEKFDLKKRYNRVIQDDVRNINDFKYDMVIFGDVLEHLPEQEAIQVWNKVSQQAGYGVISLPIIRFPQGAINDNPYEIHQKEDWNAYRVIKAFNGIVDYIEFRVVGSFFADFYKLRSDRNE